MIRWGWLGVVIIKGPWFSLGVHVHPWPLAEAHIDLHILWWVITVGPFCSQLERLEEEAAQVLGELLE